MAADDLVAPLEKLRLASADDITNEDLAKYFSGLILDIHKERNDNNYLCNNLVDGGVLVVCLKALKSDHTTAQTKAAELIAELAKVEHCRLSCVSSGLVPVLVSTLGSESNVTALQACRALGNICYENDDGRSCVAENGGGEQLLSLLIRVGKTSDEPQQHQLRVVATGFLLNLIHSFECIQDEPLHDQLLDILIEYLDKYADDEDIPSHVMLSLSCVADTVVGVKVVLSGKLCPQLKKVLEVNQYTDVLETCVELITNLTETEEVKTEFAKSGLCGAVLDVVNKRCTPSLKEVSTHIIKLATDLIVVILTGDESMNILYGSGVGPVYVELGEWLCSSEEDLQIAGSLAMGNFARSDSHCIDMVQNGIVARLLKVLSSHNTGDGDIRLQHAILSALRNLSIAKQNKQPIINQGVMDVLLPMCTEIQTFPVVFKLLATLRMVIDGQQDVAIQVGNNEAVVACMVSWCGTMEHPGVQGEAVRLLAWIIKNCGGNKQVIQNLVNSQCLSPLVSMLSSEHGVMVNEAGISLAIIFTVYGVDVSMVDKVKPLKLTDNLIHVINNISTIPPEIICNVLTAATAFVTTDSAVELLRSELLSSALNSLSTNEHQQLNTLAVDLLQKLQLK